MEDTEIQNIKEKREYEVAFLAKSEEHVPEAKQMLLSRGAEITEEGQVRQIALAYPIQGARQAHFGFIRAKLDPEQAKVLEKDIELHPGFLRALVLKLTVSARQAGSGDRPRFGNRGSAAPKSVSENRPVATPAALSNEALEKKIEEILQ